MTRDDAIETVIKAIEEEVSPQVTRVPFDPEPFVDALAALGVLKLRPDNLGAVPKEEATASFERSAIVAPSEITVRTQSEAFKDEIEAMTRLPPTETVQAFGRRWHISSFDHARDGTMHGILREHVETPEAIIHPGPPLSREQVSAIFDDKGMPRQHVDAPMPDVKPLWTDPFADLDLCIREQGLQWENLGQMRIRILGHATEHQRELIERYRPAGMLIEYAPPRCEPPPEHREKRWHWTTNRDDYLAPRLWDGKHWTALNGIKADPASAYEAGWRYVAPCEEPKP